MNRYKILAFIALIIVLLAVVSVFFPKNGLPFFGGKYLFFPTLDEVLTSKEGSSVDEKMAKLEQSMKIRAIADSIYAEEQQAYNDSLRFLNNFFDTHPAKFFTPNNSPDFFFPLFEAMDSCRTDSTTLHIMHYGDSQIEEDRITSYVRYRLQQQFGGGGVGLVPIMQPIPSASVSQSASGNLERLIVAGMHKAKANSNRYGILGQFAVLSGSGSATVRSNNYSRTLDNVKQWNRVRLFLNRNDTKFTATINSTTKTIEKAKSTPSELSWTLDKSVKNITIKFAGTAELSAISLENSFGVNVNNVPLRGSSGTFFTQIDKTAIAHAAKALNVRLIILEFGGNMIPSITEKNVTQYAQSIAKQIAYFKDVCPNAKVVVVGPSDMSTKVGGKLKTYRLLPLLVEKMKESAIASGAGFWDMFAVMGGENSMIDWVKHKPALAAPDYIHFTPKGADKIAEMLYNSLNNYYLYYRLQKKQVVQK